MSSRKKSKCMSQRKHALVYHCPDCGKKLQRLDRKYKQDHLLLCLKCRMAESLRKLKRWKCSLCNICLPDDAEARIKRLNDEGDDNTPTTAHASEAAPAGVNIQFGWDAGESQNDSLHAGGSQDTLYEDEDEKRIDRELRKEHGLFLKSILDDLDS